MGRALLIVDVQNDFVPPDGALAVPDGHEVVEPIDRLRRSGAFDLVIATRDWHPPDHASFAPHGGPWPEHCVAGTPGAELHPAIQEGPVHHVVDKGTERTGDGYSAFEAPALRELLREAGIDHVTVTGLAADVCVRHTALDALREGFRVTVPRAAVRGIDPERTAAALRELEEAGAEIA